MAYLLDSSPVSRSGSFEATALATFLQEPDDATFPPRIDRFSFEGDRASCNIPVSFSSQFLSYYGIPYERDPSSEYNGDADSELSSGGPETPPAREPSALPLLTPLSVTTRHKSMDDPFRVSSTLFLDSHSLIRTEHSLLHDTPSFAELQSVGSQPSIKSLDYLYDSIKSSSSQTISQPNPMPTSTPPLFGRQARPSVDSTRSVASNRRITVHQLALDLPLARSRSSSLSAFVRALELASPGWYQSLVESALPSMASESPLIASPAVSLGSPSPAMHPRDSQSRGGSYNASGLPPDMLRILDGLDDLACEIRRLPIPRPRTMTFDVLATAFYRSKKTQTPAKHRTFPATMTPASPTLCLRERRLTAVRVPSEIASSTQTLSRDWDDFALARPKCDQRAVAMDNLAHHPKLTKTLGLRSPPSRSLPSGTQGTPSRWKHGDGLPMTALSPDSSPHVSPPMASSDLPTITPEKGLETPQRAPASLKFPSLFRRRPTALMPMGEYHFSGSPMRSSARQGASPSELGMWQGDHIVSTNSSVGRTFRQYSLNWEQMQPTTRQPALGSFLPM